MALSKPAIDPCCAACRSMQIHEGASFQRLRRDQRSAIYLDALVFSRTPNDIRRQARPQCFGLSKGDTLDRKDRLSQGNKNAEYE